MRARAFCTGPTDRVTILEPQPYRDRDGAIVRASGLLVAAPLLPEHEEPRSGTWMSVRLADSADTPVVILRAVP